VNKSAEPLNPQIKIMKFAIKICSIVIMMTACTNNQRSDSSSYFSSDKELKIKAMNIAENYAANRLKNSEKTISDNGSVILSSGEIKTLIDPREIITGDINGDSFNDAIITLHTFQGEKRPLKSHLILLNRNGKIEISKEMDGDIKFLLITDGTIYTETSKMAADSPFADCQVCKEIKKYKFINGDTVRIK
jgi:hypothetical protein